MRFDDTIFSILFYRAFGPIDKKHICMLNKRKSKERESKIFRGDTFFDLDDADQFFNRPK